MFKYISPLLLALYGFYILPWLISKIVQYERHERKSLKEESFMNRNTFMMILNSLIIPFITIAVISYIDQNALNS